MDVNIYKEEEGRWRERESLLMYHPLMLSVEPDVPTEYEEVRYSVDYKKNQARCLPVKIKSGSSPRSPIRRAPEYSRRLWAGPLPLVAKIKEHKISRIKFYAE